MKNHIFKPSSGRILGNLIGSAILVFGFLYGMFAVIWATILRSYVHVKITMPYVLGVIGAISAAWALYSALYKHNYIIEASEDGVRFLRGKKAFKTFPAADCIFTSFIHTTRYRAYFIPLFSTERRCLVVRTFRDGKISEKRYHIKTLNSDNFDSFMVQVPNPHKNPHVIALKEAKAAAKKAKEKELTESDASRFDLRRDERLKKLRSGMVGSLITFFVLGIILGISIYFIPFANDLKARTLLWLFVGFGSFLILLVSVLCIITFFTYARLKRTMPDHITLYKDSIEVNDELFLFMNIENISLPKIRVKVTARNRRIVIVKGDGTKHIYSLGGESFYTDFPHYDLFYKQISSALPQKVKFLQ